MTCKKCGAKILSQWKFCSRCGEKTVFNTKNISSVSSYNVLNSSRKIDKKDKAIDVIILIFAVFSVIFKIIFVYFMGINLSNNLGNIRIITANINIISEAIWSYLKYPPISTLYLNIMIMNFYITILICTIVKLLSTNTHNNIMILLRIICSSLIFLYYMFGLIAIIFISIDMDYPVWQYGLFEEIPSLAVFVCSIISLKRNKNRLHL